MSEELWGRSDGGRESESGMGMEIKDMGMKVNRNENNMKFQGVGSV